MNTLSLTDVQRQNVANDHSDVRYIAYLLRSQAKMNAIYDSLKREHPLTKT